MIAKDRTTVSDTRPYGCGSMDNVLVDYKMDLRQLEAVSSPSLHQTPEPSLLFPSMITAFLTGSRMGELDCRLHTVGSTDITHQSMGGSGLHEL